ncbi:glycosyltransferase [Paraburkholderia solisilvae]|uniref:4'-demethylrebeccamycin synthase n=1 Tax=Paraburkholderia solisilvae TaxID=624376 RepID=A0A6J5DNF1_9BURK|nr:glycosyltransferase [Paraburkholderia solisilvae]CAB3754761.1 4'-demethylrebeccamycin synthase [Paraburkholderia solisilvae]
MKILIASTPASGLFNPLLAIGRILIAAGHEVTALTGSAFRQRVEGIGAKFHPLPAQVDFDPGNIHAVAPELKNTRPGPEWLRISLERVFVDSIRGQHEGTGEVLRDLLADVIVVDDMFFGVLPMLLGPSSERPPVIVCGTSVLHWRREDGAPVFSGLPPATTKAQFDEYATIARDYDRIVNQPLALRLNQVLAGLGLGPVHTPLLECVVELADVDMQLSVPGFEFPRAMPATVNFVGALPIIPNQAPRPSWAHELDGSRKVVLVTQGTVANHDFSLLVAPTLAALANERDVLVVVTAGGRPTDAIPGPIPGNARLASYLPFEWILPKTDVFVTNGGYGSVNQAMSFSVPLVTAGLTEDKAAVNARVAWSGVGIDLATNQPSPESLRDAIRTVLDNSEYRARASLMAEEFARIDTRSEIVRIVAAAASRRR